MSVLLNLCFLAPLAGLHLDYGLENANIVSYDKQEEVGDYNRLRVESTVEHGSAPGVLGKLIVDNETRYGYAARSLVNDTSVYRGYVEYRGPNHFWVAGRQRVPFGVGRIWNPIDVFNPIDVLTVETEERRGTEALRYEYAMGDLSNLDLTVSREKSAARIKGYLDFADLALVGIYDNERDRDIIGYEATGELFTTGIELRSEGGSFHDRRTGERAIDFIAGAEYGFANSLTMLGEYRYDEASKTAQLGAMLSYQPSPLLIVQLLNIVNLADGSRALAPSCEYSLSDEMTLSLGAFFYTGDDSDAFGTATDRYYLNWYVHF